MLRAIRGDLGEIKADIREIKEKISVLEGGYASLYAASIAWAAMSSESSSAWN